MHVKTFFSAVTTLAIILQCLTSIGYAEETSEQSSVVASTSTKQEEQQTTTTSSGELSNVDNATSSAGNPSADAGLSSDVTKRPASKQPATEDNTDGVLSTTRKNKQDWQQQTPIGGYNRLRSKGLTNATCRFNVQCESQCCFFNTLKCAPFSKLGERCPMGQVKGGAYADGCPCEKGLECVPQGKDEKLGKIVSRCVSPSADDDRHSKELINPQT